MVGLVQLENATADTIDQTLKTCLLQLEISFENCRGQAYDGAASFQGHVRGVAKKFEDVNAAAMSIHCLVHCINLTLQEVARAVRSIKEALNFAMDVIQSIKYSPKQQMIFETIQHQQDSSTTSGIRTLCPTRWAVHAGALQANLNNYECLKETLIFHHRRVMSVRGELMVY